MSKAIVPDQLWAEMTDEQRIDAVVTGRATLKQMSQGLLDGSEKLRRECQDSLAHLPRSLENLAVEPAREIETSLAHLENLPLSLPRSLKRTKKLVVRKPRF